MNEEKMYSAKEVKAIILAERIRVNIKERQSLGCPPINSVINYTLSNRLDIPFISDILDSGDWSGEEKLHNDIKCEYEKRIRRLSSEVFSTFSSKIPPNVYINFICSKAAEGDLAYMNLVKSIGGLDTLNIDLK